MNMEAKGYIGKVIKISKQGKRGTIQKFSSARGNQMGRTKSVPMEFDLGEPIKGLQIGDKVMVDETKIVSNKRIITKMHEI